MAAGNAWTLSLALALIGAGAADARAWQPGVAPARVGPRAGAPVVRTGMPSPRDARGHGREAGCGRGSVLGAIAGGLLGGRSGGRGGPFGRAAGRAC